MHKIIYKELKMREPGSRSLGSSARKAVLEEGPRRALRKSDAARARERKQLRKRRPHEQP